MQACLVGDVQGEGGTGAVPAGGGVAWACRGRSGASWAGVCRPGWLRHGHARKVLDRVPAGRAPPIAGKVRGLEQGARVGEHLGSKGQLQDVVVGCFAAGCSNAHGGGHVHGMDA